MKCSHLLAAVDEDFISSNPILLSLGRRANAGTQYLPRPIPTATSGTQTEHQFALQPTTKRLRTPHTQSDDCTVLNYCRPHSNARTNPDAGGKEMVPPSSPRSTFTKQARNTTRCESYHTCLSGYHNQGTEVKPFFIFCPWRQIMLDLIRLGNADIIGRQTYLDGLTDVTYYNI